MTAYVYEQRDSYSTRFPGTPVPDPAAPPPPGMFEQFSFANWRSSTARNIRVHLMGDNIDVWYSLSSLAAGGFLMYPAYEDVQGPDWFVRGLEVEDAAHGVLKAWNADPAWHGARLLVGLTYDAGGNPDVVLLVDDREDAPTGPAQVGVEPIS